MLTSVQNQDAPIGEILLLDDGSNPPLTDLGGNVEIFRHAKCRGYIASRNELARRSKNEFMFFFDDDVVLDNPLAVSRAAAIMASDSTVGAVAFRQRALDGSFPQLQPVYGNRVRQIATYFGWAHLIRRSAWEKVGPFMQMFEYGYEESEFSLRLFDAGFKVMGDPMLSVIHDGADNRKDLAQRHFLNVRNTLFTYLLRYPATCLPSWTKNFLLNVQPHPQVRESTLAFRLRLMGAVVAKLPYLIVERKPVSTDAISAYFGLQASVRSSE
jgi:GT2 family glycosyltransferase